LSGRLFRHGNSNRIPQICAGMPPAGARRQNRATPQHNGGHGPSLGPTCQGDRRRSLSRPAVIDFFLCVVASSLVCQAQPYLRHPARFLGGTFAAVTPAEGPSLGDRRSNPARVASRRGSSCRIAEQEVVFASVVRAKPNQLASASASCGAPGRSRARSDRMALTTSRRSRMPTSLAMVSSALRSPDTR